jgi:hypothetical protein
MILIGCGNAFAMTPRTAIIMHAIPRDSSGAASGLNTATSKLGSALGTPILSSIFLAIGKTSYIEQMQSTGLGLQQLRNATIAWRQAAQNADLNPVSQHVLPDQLARQIETGLHYAFTGALGQTEVFAATLYVLTAGIVWFGLKPAKGNSSSAP